MMQDQRLIIREKALDFLNIYLSNFWFHLNYKLVCRNEIQQALQAIFFRLS